MAHIIGQSIGHTHPGQRIGCVQVWGFTHSKYVCDTISSVPLVEQYCVSLWRHNIPTLVQPRPCSRLALDYANPLAHLLDSVSFMDTVHIMDTFNSFTFFRDRQTFLHSN